MSDEELQVNYTLGQSLMLPCETGVPRPPNHATWRKDGHPVVPTENVSVLSDGTLLVLETSVITEGTYQCTGYYSDEPLNSTTYHVSMRQASEGSGLIHNQCCPNISFHAPIQVVTVQSSLRGQLLEWWKLGSS